MGFGDGEQGSCRAWDAGKDGVSPVGRTPTGEAGERAVGSPRVLAKRKSAGIGARCKGLRTMFCCFPFFVLASVALVGSSGETLADAGGEMAC